jgi:hypothetical protein
LGIIAAFWFCEGVTFLLAQTPHAPVPFTMTKSPGNIAILRLLAHLATLDIIIGRV